MEKKEIIYVDSVIVKCQGEQAKIGHPLVYLHISAKGEIDCPYCSSLFRLKSQQNKTG